MKDTLMFDFTSNEFVVKNGNIPVLSDIEALKMWIEKAIRTSAGYKIYSNYGNNIEKLVLGKQIGFGFTEAEIKREVTETLLKNEDIIKVNSINISRKRHELIIEIELSTVYGESTEVIRFDS